MNNFDEDGKNLNCNEGTEKLLDNNTVPSLIFLRFTPPWSKLPVWYHVSYGIYMCHIKRVGLKMLNGQHVILKYQNTLKSTGYLHFMVFVKKKIRDHFRVFSPTLYYPHAAEYMYRNSLIYIQEGLKDYFFGLLRPFL